ncbi:MAG: molybdopterin molybdotransferase MoeA [Verrucomicrobiota bacterium]
MVSFQAARSLLLENVARAATQRCRIEQAAGRVLREDVTADRAFPAFDRVMMDGHALRAADWQAGTRKFRVTGTTAAGTPQGELSAEAGTCMEVMTGAPCPVGADVIIPVEEILENGADEVVFAETAAPIAGRFIHRTGSDAAAGELLLKAGCRLGSREIGVAASCGYAWLEVAELPKIAVIATGDELVAVDEQPAPHQIRQSNAHSLAAALDQAGYAPRLVRVLGDEIDAARPVMETLLADHDWIILTGAVSKGGRDFVPELLEWSGAKKLFHGVFQRPGKPAGCWIGPSGQVIVALPGNPVAALTGLHTLVIPALAKAAGLDTSAGRRVVLAENVGQLDKFTHHLPVRLRDDGRAEAAVTGNSGDFIGLLRSDGFVTLPPRGETCTAAPFIPWL